MKRRSFLKASSIISLPIALGGIQVSALARSKVFNQLNGGDNDKILILIQLNGGNDGLNTLIPLDQYANLVKARQNIIIPESKILPISDLNGFHPVMTGMQELFNEGKMNIVQNVGYPNQNRSHFRSTDIWQTGSAADEYVDTGWFGRYLDTVYPDYPENYPNDEQTDPFGLSMGYTVSETCQGLDSNFSIAVTSPEDLMNLGEYEGDLYNGTCYGDELTFVRNEIKKTNAYSETIIAASDNGNNISTKYADDSRLAQQLKIIAKLISGGLKTKFYIATLGGFDTHSAQTDELDTTVGKHGDKLAELSNAIAAFQEDIDLLGFGEKVVGMTYSEFGRQIKSNASFGTDHGTAAPLFVFGSCVNPIIIGDNPEISDEVKKQAGVSMQYDFRSVYGSILMDWFEVEESSIKSLLFEDFQYINILKPCTQVSTNSIEELSTSVEVYPNPTSNDFIHVSFESFGDLYRISIYDVLGHEIKYAHYGSLPIGPYTNKINISELPSGQYFIRVTGKGVQQTKLFVKT